MNKNSEQKLYGLDHLRAIAITFVFLYHYTMLSGGNPSWLPAITTFGWTGVDLFFVLSGFLISSQIFAQIKQGQNFYFGTFFLKRFFRIVPAYLVTLGLYFFIPLFRERESLPPLWKFLTFTQNLGLDLKQYGTFSHAWSLCVEEHFYLFLPLVLISLQSMRLFKNSYWLLAALFLFGFIIRNYSYDQLYLPNIDERNAGVIWYKYIYYPTYNRLDGLLVGVSIATIYQFRPTVWSRISRYGNVFIVLGLAVLTGAYLLCEDQLSYNATVFGYPLVALGYGCMVIAAVSPASILYKGKPNAAIFIATLSYSIYLTHKGVIHVTQKLLAGFNIEANVLMLICTASCIVFALLLHVIIEKPFMKLRDRILYRKYQGHKIVLTESPQNS